MKTFSHFLLAVSMIVPVFAQGASNKCQRCIEWCNTYSKTDKEAQACLDRCLSQNFCNESSKNSGDLLRKLFVFKNMKIKSEKI